MVLRAHRAGDADGLHIAGPAVALLGQVAQVLEGLGVALAHHVGGGVAVKHPEQLPGAAVTGGVLPSGRGVVVGHLVADVLTVRLQLVVIGLGGVGGHHAAGRLHRRRDVGDVGGGHVLAAELLGHGEAERHILERSAARSQGVGIVDADHLVMPVQLVGQIRHQGVPHLVGGGLGAQHAGGLDVGVLTLAAGDLLDLRLQRVVDVLLHPVQVGLRGVAGSHAGTAEASLVTADVHTGQAVQIAVQQFPAGDAPAVGRRRCALLRPGRIQRAQGQDREQHDSRHKSR